MATNFSFHPCISTPQSICHLVQLFLLTSSFLGLCKHPLLYSTMKNAVPFSPTNTFSYVCLDYMCLLKEFGEILHLLKIYSSLFSTYFLKILTCRCKVLHFPRVNLFVSGQCRISVNTDVHRLFSIRCCDL